jgi:hypothetical protein
MPVQPYTCDRDVCCEQDETKPAVLYNHGNEYLHYEDDWYILAQKPDEYVVVYYKGNNDAWQGYGGAVVYTRYVPSCQWCTLTVWK